jgi:hypothetical protein
MSECELQWDARQAAVLGGNRRNLGHAGRKHIGNHWGRHYVEMHSVQSKVTR